MFQRLVRRNFIVLFSAILASTALFPRISFAERSDNVATLFGQWAKQWSQLDCDSSYTVAGCAEVCGYASSESSRIRCIGSPAKLDRLTKQLQKQKTALNRYLFAQLRKNKRIREASACALFIELASPELEKTLAKKLSKTRQFVETTDFLIANIQKSKAPPWYLPLAASQPTSLTHERQLRRVLEAGIERNAVPDEAWSHFVRHNHAFLWRGPSKITIPLIFSRLKQSKNDAEQNSLGKVLGKILSANPSTLEMINGEFQRTREAEHVRIRAISEGLSGKSPSDRLFHAYFDLVGSPNGHRALEYARENGLRPDLCQVNLDDLSGELVTRGMIRHIFQSNLRGVRFDDRCDEERRQAWIRWFSANRSKVNRSILIRVFDRLEADFLSDFSKISYPEDDFYQSELISRWCRSLPDSGESDHQAIDEMIDETPNYGQISIQRVAFCATESENSADHWGRAWARILPQLSGDQLIDISPFLENLIRQITPLERQELTGSLEDFSESRNDIGVAVSVGLISYAASDFQPEKLTDVLRLLSAAQLSNVMLRNEVRILLRNSLISRLHDGYNRSLLLNDLLDAVQALESYPDELRELIDEVRRDIETWRPFIFSA